MAPQYSGGAIRISEDGSLRMLSPTRRSMASNNFAGKVLPVSYPVSLPSKKRRRHRSPTLKSGSLRADKQAWRAAGDLNSRCKKASRVIQRRLPLRQTVAILPTTPHNGSSRHTVKVFYQVWVAVREVCHEAQDS